MIKLYNSLSKTLEEFKPLNKDEVRIYSCGPTVYDHAHIGNLSSYIYADTLRRVLQLEYKNVRHVMNYTDIDDKTIKRSREKYPDLEPKEALKKLTDEYIDLFKQDIKKVGIDADAIEFVRATDYIDHMKDLISKLVDKKIAYVTDDGVYFSIDAYKKSGKTYGQLSKITQSSTSEARIDNDEYDKDSVHDFALWKKQKPGEPAWDFDINGQDLKGRPGWHIECSAMSEAALGVPFDIHTGGIDLIFPHHENEIAQTTGAIDGDVMAKYFVHNNHLLVDGKKMSKSANNFYTLQDIIDKGYHPLAFRLLVLQSHYRKESNFTWESIDNSMAKLKFLQNWAESAYQLDVIRQKMNSDAQDYSEMVNNDLHVWDMLNIIELNSHTSPSDDLVKKADNILGLGLSDVKDISDGIKSKIHIREEARKNNDWEESDKLRDELEKQGIGIRDTDNGSIWYRL